MAETTTDPRVNFTDAAAEKLSDIIGNHANPVAGLRLQISGRKDGRFQHLLSLVEDGAQQEGDLALESGDIRVYVEPRDADYLDGLEIDFYDDGAGNQGLEFKNPNPLWRDPREFQLQDLFDRQINPQIAAHGGMISLIGVREKTAFVQFGGGCVGCGMLSVTLKQGVEVAVKDQIPEIDEIVDITDHNQGENPYYQPAKK
jgi:Fe/S biogenesis protein NfuA